MNQCFICNNKTSAQSKNQSICTGCLGLLVHPKFDCQHCGVALHTSIAMCGSCQKQRPLYSEVKYACVYQAPIDKWVQSLKFGKNILMSRLFADVLTPVLEQIDRKFCLMPVPLHISRLRNRGFNQSYEMACDLAKKSKRILDVSLKRQKKTQMQAQLKLSQRAKNVSNAFVVKGKLKSTNIVLIDDVMTSGNTLKECTKTLIKAGAEEVKILVFARKSVQ